jgi:hypothetical protein
MLVLEVNQRILQEMLNLSVVVTDLKVREFLEDGKDYVNGGD